MPSGVYPRKNEADELHELLTECSARFPATAEELATPVNEWRSLLDVKDAKALILHLVVDIDNLTDSEIQFFAAEYMEHMQQPEVLEAIYAEKGTSVITGLAISSTTELSVPAEVTSFEIEQLAV